MTADWDIPVGSSRLPVGELHVWRIPLDPDEGAVAALHATLAPDERARADRLRLPRDRRRFITARGILRALLGQVLEQDPAAIAFLYGAQGKPSLPPSSTVPRLAFNVSHSSGLGLIALRWGADIGVDIERIRENWGWQGIADRFFCATEIAWLQALPVGEQHLGFFTLWTRKEAYLKGRGAGVWHELHRYDVTHSRVSEDGAIPGDAQDIWHLHDLDVGEQCKAALAVSGPMPTVHTCQWPPSGL